MSRLDADSWSRTGGRGDQLVAIAQRQDGEHRIVGQRLGFGGRMTQALQFTGARIEDGDACIARADPQPAEAVASQ
jgi:hypothetical protein